MDYDITDIDIDDELVAADEITTTEPAISNPSAPEQSISEAFSTNPDKSPPGYGIQPEQSLLEERYPGSQIEKDAASADVATEPNSETITKDGIGTDDSEHWEIQTTPFTCGIMSVRSILESLTGNQLTESQLVYDATTNGWLTESGMHLSDIANLMEYKGVACEVVTNGSIEGLTGELEAGNRAVVAVDSGELLSEESVFADFFPDDGADHAIVVSGVTVDDNGIPVVIVNDSGVIDGAGKEISLEVFADAWEDSKFSYVVTRDNIVVDGGQGFGDSEMTTMSNLERIQFLKDI